MLGLEAALQSAREMGPKSARVIVGKSGVLLVPPELIDTTKQPREDFANDDEVNLADSIRAERAAGHGLEATGILAPLLLRPGKGERLLLVAGERRLRAARELSLPFVPCVIQAVSDVDAFRIGITENIQRKALSPVEEGDAFLYLQEHGDTIPRIADAMGVREGYVNKRLAVARRAPDLREMVARRPGTVEHSRLIDMVKKPEERARLIERVVESAATVEDIKEEIRQLDRRGLVKAARAKTHPKEYGSIGNKIAPRGVLVDWDGIMRDLANSSARLTRNLSEHRVRGPIRSRLLDSIAAAEKDLRAAREALGSDLS